MKKSFLGVLASVSLLFVGVGANPAQASGSLDTSFDSDGKVITVFGASNESANSIAIQSNGKIVVAGSSSNESNNEFAVARFNADGSLDSSFDSDGKVTTAIGSNAEAYSVAIQSDGKIIVAGNAVIGGRDEIAVARYNTDGSLDSSFDSDGKVTTTIGASDYANSVAIQSDGKIVVAGTSASGSDSNIMLVRYNANGTLDSTFDSDGKVITAIGSNTEAYSVAIQSNGKIVVAGFTYNGASHEIAVARYNSDGSLDSTFDSDGTVTTTIGSDDLAKSVAIQSDGKIVVAGSSVSGGQNNFALVRYNTDGSLDPSFDPAVTPIGSLNDYANSVALQSNGKIVVAGSSDNGTNRVFAVARYNIDGSLDTSFDSDGKVTTAIGSGDNANSVAIQSDGKIVVAGASNNGSNDDFAILRYGQPAATAPGAPTIGSATVLSPTSVSITFTAPTSNGGATIETYTATSTPGSITGRVFQSGSGSITITGLTSSTAYTFRVTASNSAGTSSASGATSSITTSSGDSETSAAALAAKEAAAAKREAEKQEARVEIKNSLVTSKVISLEMFTKAEISGITAENIAEVQIEIAALPQTSRADLNQVLKIARKYEVVGKIASDQVATLLPVSLIEIGLIPEDNKYKASITSTIKKLPPSDRSSYASIKKAIDAKMAEIQSRKDRIAQVTARINSRYSK